MYTENLMLVLQLTVLVWYLVLYNFVRCTDVT